jgi:hypothetical protein
MFCGDKKCDTDSEFIFWVSRFGNEGWFEVITAAGVWALE